MEVKKNPNMVAVISSRIMASLNDLASNEHLVALNELAINDGTRRKLTSHIAMLLPILKRRDPMLFCELSSLSYYASLPELTVRFAKDASYRRLRAEQRACGKELKFLQILNKIALLSNQEQPCLLIKQEVDTTADPSDLWTVNFVYELIGHLRLAGVRVILSCVDNRQEFEQIAAQHAMVDVNGFFQVSCKCDLEHGYLNMLTQLLEGSYGQCQELKHFKIPLELKTPSQFNEDKCGESALVEPQIYQLEVAQSSVAHTHLLVTHNGPLTQSLVTVEKNSDVQIDSVNFHVVN